MGWKPFSIKLALHISVFSYPCRKGGKPVPCLSYLWQYFHFMVTDNTQVFHKQSRSLDLVWINVSSV